ncbi:hypothetical protein AMST5_01075 [freshwater sediment metagenome]|uniref:Uncharacterized protein n=1 Tax=freshwater sediment metagenome TaxID=556182 RepID=A0AA48RCD1_9ZZZZ
MRAEQGLRKRIRTNPGQRRVKRRRHARGRARIGHRAARARRVVSCPTPQSRGRQRCNRQSVEFQIAFCKESRGRQPWMQAPDRRLRRAPIAGDAIIVIDARVRILINEVKAEDAREIGIDSEDEQFFQKA